MSRTNIIATLRKDLAKVAAHDPAEHLARLLRGYVAQISADRGKTALPHASNFRMWRWSHRRKNGQPKRGRYTRLVSTKRSQEGQRNVQLIDDTGRLVAQSNIAMKLNCERAEQAGAKAVPGRLLDRRAARFRPGQCE